LATKDAQLSSLYPDINISGKNEPFKGIGYGTIKKIEGGYITYPAMYINSSDDYNIKESFIIGGFDLSKINGDVMHASLKFYINYSSNIRKNVCIILRPVKIKWDDEKITYLDIYKDTQMNAELLPIVESNENKCKIIVFNIKKNSEADSNAIPFKDSYRTVSIDVTDMVTTWIKEPEKYHGFLIDPMWRDDIRYCTTDYSNQISDFGIIEIASTEWYNWDGVIPEYFYLDNGSWINIDNKATGKIKYIPRLEIEVKR